MRPIYFFIALMGFFISCDKDEPNPNNIDVNLQFLHLVDNAPVELNQLIYKNALNQDFSIKTVKYFVSGFKLYKTDGSVLSFDDIHYIDIYDEESLNYTLTDKISGGDYSGISFIHGLAKDENISGRFTEPPESLMEWPEPMGGGYHFMKLEGEYISAENYFNFHSGGLDGEAYEVHIDLNNQPFTVTGNELNLQIRMEIQNWFTNPVDWDFTYFGPGIMGNHEAQQTVQKNGANVYSFAVIESL